MTVHNPGDKVYLTPTDEHRTYFKQVGAPHHQHSYPARIVGVSEGDNKDVPTRYNVHAFTDSHHASHYFIGVDEKNISAEYPKESTSDEETA